MSAEDLILEEYLKLDREIKEKTKRLEELKEWCKSKGSFATQLFVCALMPRERTSLAPLDEVAAALGKDALERFNLIRRHSFCIVQVTRSGLAIPGAVSLGAVRP